MYLRDFAWVIIIALLGTNAQASELVCDGARGATPLCAEFRSALSARAEAEDLRKQVLEVRAPPWEQAEQRRADARYDQAVKYFVDEYFGDSAQAYTEAAGAYRSLLEKLEKTIQETREAAKAAMDAGKTDQAAELYGRLSTLKDLPEYRSAVESAKVAGRDRERISSAEQAVASGNFMQADSILTTLESGKFEEDARRLRAKMSSARQQKTVSDLITKGYASLDHGDFDAAVNAFEKATVISPGSVGARDGLSEARARRNAMLATVQRARLEQAEREGDWISGLDAIASLKTLEPGIPNNPGLEKKFLRLSEAERSADFHLAHPERFTSKNVRSDIELLLASSEKLEGPSPALVQKLTKLREMYTDATTMRELVLQSDGKTIVRIVPGTQLGQLKEKRLSVLPGKYRISGRRPGFREAVTELQVEKNGGPYTVKIVANEKF